MFGWLSLDKWGLRREYTWQMEISLRGSGKKSGRATLSLVSYEASGYANASGEGEGVAGECSQAREVGSTDARAVRVSASCSFGICAMTLTLIERVWHCQPTPFDWLLRCGDWSIIVLPVSCLLNIYVFHWCTRPQFQKKEHWNVGARHTIHSHAGSQDEGELQNRKIKSPKYWFLTTYDFLIFYECDFQEHTEILHISKSGEGQGFDFLWHF